MRIDSITNAVVALCALAVAGTVVGRELTRGERAAASSSPARLVDDWGEIVASGTPLGSADGKVQVVVFDDLECPFCRELHVRLRALERRFGSQVSVSVAHFPLSMHRFALPAARAAECAKGEQRFAEFLDVVFEKQDSLGLKTWTSFAAESGVRDSLSIQQCAQATDTSAHIKSGLRVGKRLAIRATPTILINSWQLGVPPDEARLATIVERLLKGEAAAVVIGRQ